MADTSQISPFVFGCGGGLVLNKDSFSYQPGESKVLTNFEPDVNGGYKKILGTSLYNSNIVPQVSSASERIVMSAIFKYGLWPNDAIMCKQLVRGMGVTKHHYTRVQGLPSTTT